MTKKAFCVINFIVGDNMKELKITPVAKIKNGYKEKFGVPRQSGLAPSVESEIVFEESFKDENMIRDIEEFSHLWLIWGFSENIGEWTPTVRPPKLGGNKRTGVFATRSPYRPNSLGLTVVKLNGVKNTPDGKVLVVSGADLVNDTLLGIVAICSSLFFLYENVFISGLFVFFVFGFTLFCGFFL